MSSASLGTLSVKFEICMFEMIIFKGIKWLSNLFFNHLIII